MFGSITRAASIRGIAASVFRHRALRKAAAALSGAAVVGGSIVAPAAASPMLSAGDMLNMTDFGMVRFTGQVAPGQYSFHDAGVMPVTGIIRSGTSYPGLDGAQAFLRYDAAGIQHVTAQGILAVYDRLTYTLETYTGQATFDWALDSGAATVQANELNVLGGGSLIDGWLASLQDGSIAGVFNLTIDVPLFDARALTLSVVHPESDINRDRMDEGILTLSGGTVRGVLAVPEPPLPLLLNVGMALLGALRRKKT